MKKFRGSQTTDHRLKGTAACFLCDCVCFVLCAHSQCNKVSNKNGQRESHGPTVEKRKTKNEQSTAGGCQGERGPSPYSCISTAPTDLLKQPLSCMLSLHLSSFFPLFYLLSSFFAFLLALCPSTLLFLPCSSFLPLFCHIRPLAPSH